MNQHEIKNQFPVFSHEPSLVYLDSAATCLVPTRVINSMNTYYEQCPVSVRRGMYSLAQKALCMVEEARKKIADFIHAMQNEIIFTSGTTAGINMLCRILESRVGAETNIVLTRFEHHSNLIPWQQLAKRTGATIRFIEITPEGDIDLVSAEKMIDGQTVIVSFSYVSNVLGSISPAESIITLAKKVGAMTIIDAAQAVGHMPVDVKKLDCDFLVFSGHKMYGPKGIGVLYGKKNLLESLEPTTFGGDMILEVTDTSATWAELPYRFEAGSQNLPGIIGLGAAVSFIDSIGFEQIQMNEETLITYALTIFSQIDGLQIIGPKRAGGRSGIFSFVIDGIHPHDIGEVFNDRHLAVRVGHHCAMPLMRTLGLVGTTRVSFGVYTTEEDIDRAAECISEAMRLFRT
jgi:cysteine desulfurase/selenocysteine lyase